MGNIRIHGDDSAFYGYYYDGLSDESLYSGDNELSNGTYDISIYTRSDYKLDRIYYLDGLGQEIEVGNTFRLVINGTTDLYIETSSNKPKVTVIGVEGTFNLYSYDDLYQQEELHVGDNFMYAGDYTFELVVHENYELVSATRTNRAGEIVDIVANKFTSAVGEYELIVEIVTKEKNPDRDVTGFNKLYKVDKQLLHSIAGERFVGGGVDLAEYFINILELPFSLDESIIGEEQAIRLGSEFLNTQAPEILKDSVRVDLGTIHVPKKYNNSYDYMNTTITLHLPFSDSISLEMGYVIGYDISITYIIDLYSGDMTINVSSSRVNKVIHSQTSKIGRDIPFIRRVGGNITNQLTTSSGVVNDVLAPYIEVIRNKIYDESNIFKTNVTVYDSLSNITGYVSVNKIMLSTSATAGEKDMILNHLRNGVYIK